MPLSRHAGVFLEYPAGPGRGGHRRVSDLRAKDDRRRSDFALAEGRTPPRIVRRLGVEVYEAIFRFETETGRGHGVVRLPVEKPTRAWVLMTSLDELKGHGEAIGTRRLSGDAYSRNFGGKNWLDQR